MIERGILPRRRRSMANTSPAIELAGPPAEARKRMAKQGFAMPDGSFPIPDANHLRKAIQAFGRAPEEKRDAVKRHIKKRARALGVVHLIPGNWN